MLGTVGHLAIYTRSEETKMLFEGYQSHSTDETICFYTDFNHSVPDIDTIVVIDATGENGDDWLSSAYKTAEELSNSTLLLCDVGSFKALTATVKSSINACLLKPFTPAQLYLQLDLLLRSHQEKQQLNHNAQAANEMAMMALASNSEYGHTIQFIEKSYEAHNTEVLAHQLFAFLNGLGISASIMMQLRDNTLFYDSTGNQPTADEQQLLVGFKDAGRILDFDAQTLINFTQCSLLVKNMPLDDPEKYGRLKDLMPAILGSIDAKLKLLQGEDVVFANAEQTLNAIKRFRRTLFDLANSQNQKNSEALQQVATMSADIYEQLPRLGLEDDQETFIINLIEKTMDDLAETFQFSSETTASLLFTIEDMKELKQSLEDIVALFEAQKAPPPEMSLEDAEEEDDGIELF